MGVCADGAELATKGEESSIEDGGVGIPGKADTERAVRNTRFSFCDRLTRHSLSVLVAARDCWAVRRNVSSVILPGRGEDN